MVLRALVIAALLCSGAGISLGVNTELVHACSCTDCDVVRDAPVIIGGRVTGWEPTGEEHPVPGSGFVPIVFDVAVERVYKGAAERDIRVLDYASLSDRPAGWFGASGACGKFDQDPAGQYVIMGVEPAQDAPGYFVGSRLWVLFLADEPDGEWYERALARLGPYAPAAGSGRGSGTDDETRLRSVGALLAGAGVVLGAAWAGSRRVSSRTGRC